MSANVTSNNLANSRTAGFKAGHVVFATQAPAGQVGTGVSVSAVISDFSQGALEATSNPLDLALQGNGLFMVEGPSGERFYTRSGQFHLNTDGEIVTPAGYRLLGVSAENASNADSAELEPLKIPLGSVATSEYGTTATLTGFSIRDDGHIEGQYSDGVNRDLGQIRVARFANPSGLEAHGDYVLEQVANSGMPYESNPGSKGAATITSGAIELSNTDVGQSLIELALASQQFAANAEVFRTADSMLDELIHLRRYPR